MSVYITGGTTDAITTAVVSAPGDIVEVIILRDQHTQLIRGALGIGGNAERAAQLVSVI